MIRVLWESCWNSFFQLVMEKRNRDRDIKRESLYCPETRTKNTCILVLAAVDVSVFLQSERGQEGQRPSLFTHLHPQSVLLAQNLEFPLGDWDWNAVKPSIQVPQPQWVSGNCTTWWKESTVSITSASQNLPVQSIGPFICPASKISQ